MLARLRDQLDQRGTLDVLRHGIELLGLRQPLKLAEFKPALAMNPDILVRYDANRLRVVRQVRYSLHNENCIDLVLFLNGIPVATVELKTDFTQSIDDAVYQYKRERLPRPKGQAAEPLLSFPSGTLVHFAVSNHEVQMVTKLAGPATEFLTFNKGDDGGKGNPVNPVSGHRTAYLWEEIWERHSWLEILGRYLVTQRNDRKQIEKILFPRFHQLDVTRKLQAAVLGQGAAGKYLVQHSAGSGKTNSIAWNAHFLAELHDAENRKVFDSVLVVSDRTVIDSQLQEALFDFQRQTGVDVSKDPLIYPAYNSVVAADAQEQTLRTIVDQLITKKGDYRDLFTTQSTFLTRALGRVYKLPVATRNGWEMRQYPADSGHSGILTDVSFVALHSHPGRSSPTLRGKAIREIFMCQNVPDPPPDVNFAAVDLNPNAAPPTARDRLEAHRTQPMCAGCHSLMDPLGLTLENFDGAGSFRTQELGAQIDVSGSLDGAEFSSARGLGQALHDSPLTSYCLVDKIYRSGVGRSLAGDEQRFVVDLIKDFQANGHRVPDLMRAIAVSSTFYAVSPPVDKESIVTDVGAAGTTRVEKS